MQVPAFSGVFAIGSNCEGRVSVCLEAREYVLGGGECEFFAKVDDFDSDH